MSHRFIRLSSPIVYENHYINLIQCPITNLGRSLLECRSQLQKLTPEIKIPKRSAIKSSDLMYNDNIYIA